MECKDVLNLVAIIVIPIVAVLVSVFLQNRAEKRRDKMQIFKILMTARLYGWTVDSVHALNIIDIVFVNDKKVRAAWKNYNEKTIVSDPKVKPLDDKRLKDIEQAQYKLLETMSNSLGYKNKITWETIQKPYIPDGLLLQIEAQRRMQQASLYVMDSTAKQMKDFAEQSKQTQKEKASDKENENKENEN